MFSCHFQSSTSTRPWFGQMLYAHTAQWPWYVSEWMLTTDYHVRRTSRWVKIGLFFLFFFCRLGLTFRGHGLISPWQVWLGLLYIEGEGLYNPHKVCMRRFVEWKKIESPKWVVLGTFSNVFPNVRYLIAVSSYVFRLLSNNTGLGPSIVNCDDVVRLNCVTRLNEWSWLIGRGPFSVADVALEYSRLTL
jgi:hypothetical protein